eukprot:5360990-Lingulodinium_polyedra.AAC.1
MPAPSTTPPPVNEFESDEKPEDGLATANEPPKPTPVVPQVGTLSMAIGNYGAARKVPLRF